MSIQINNGNGFKTPEGQRLGKFDAPLVRGVLHECDTSIGLLFNVFSRMTEPHQYHTAPAATYGTSALQEALSGAQAYTAPQAAHDNVNVHPERREAEVATLETMGAAPSYEQAAHQSSLGVEPSQPTDELTQKMEELRREAYSKMNEAYENA